MLIKKYIIWVFCCTQKTYILYSFITIRLQTQLFWISLQEWVLDRGGGATSKMGGHQQKRALSGKKGHLQREISKQK